MAIIYVKVSMGNTRTILDKRVFEVDTSADGVPESTDLADRIETLIRAYGTEKLGTVIKTLQA